MELRANKQLLWNRVHNTVERQANNTSTSSRAFPTAPPLLIQSVNTPYNAINSILCYIEILLTWELIPKTVEWNDSCEGCPSLLTLWFRYIHNICSPNICKRKTNRTNEILDKFIDWYICIYELFLIEKGLKGFHKIVMECS